MCPTRATVSEVELPKGTTLCGGPLTCVDEPLDEEPPPEQATTRVLNKKIVPNDRTWERKEILPCVMSNKTDHVTCDEVTHPYQLLLSCLQWPNTTLP